jgi:succinate dehydrogenase / fumarate reductase cytochrome b subunit
VKQNSRPINVGLGDLASFRWPITALTSITHRVAGVILFLGVAFMLYALDLSLSSEEDFNYLKKIMVSPLGKFFTWGVLSALAYHFVAGIKHVVMDGGFGETLEGGQLAAKLTLFFSLVLIVLAAVWVI